MEFTEKNSENYKVLTFLKTGTICFTGKTSSIINKWKKNK